MAKKKRFFDPDSRFTKVFTIIADLIVLNALTLVCCIPIVTAGASLTAMYAGVFRLKRGEEGYLVKEFFRDFKNNFKQSTAMWLIVVVLLVLLYLDYRIFSGLAGWAEILQIITYAVGILLYLTLLYALPLQARFVNSVKATLRNAVLLSFSKLQYTLLIGVINALPVILMMYVPMIVGVYVLIGVSGTVWLCTGYYNKVFSAVRVDEG